MDFRAAAVFKEAGIDFCCGGKMTIGQACDEKRLDQKELEKKLADLDSAHSDTVDNFNEWDLSFLADYIGCNVQCTRGGSSRTHGI